MKRDDITHMAREVWGDDSGKPWSKSALLHLEAFAALVAAAERNKLAQWMIDRGYATGHGDTTEDLLQELEWQIAENWTRGMVNGVEAEREACASEVWPTETKVWSEEELQAMTAAFNRAQEKHGWYETLMAVGASVLKLKADAIRARGDKK